MNLTGYYNMRHILRVLISYFPNGVVGGSIMFQAHRLLSRKPKDIDFFLPDNTEIPDWLSRYADSGIGSETITDINGEKIKRVGFKVEEIPICLFLVPPDQCKSISCYSDFFKMHLPTQYPIYGINAKKVYAQTTSGLKHKQDYDEIMSNMFPKTK